MTGDTGSMQPMDSARRIHSQISGKLYKGHGTVAAISSIPSKYQTIVTNNSDQLGFTSKAKRFSSEDYSTEQPGPARYNHGTDMGKLNFHSKKGLGTFASKSKRIPQNYMLPTPGAGSYNITGKLQTRKDFNYANSSSFHLPIAVKTKDLGITQHNDVTPAPNIYTACLRFLQSVKFHIPVNKAQNAKTNVITAQAAFKSRTKRQGLQQVSTRIPSPSHYNVKDDLLKASSKAPTSSFKSKTIRKVIEDETFAPGPGAYKPYEELMAEKKISHPRKHYLCISAPAMPLPPPVENPGPGSYELVNYEGPSKHYMSSSVFVSNSSRWTFGNVLRDENPGPSTYKPEKTGKQSFLYNANNRWIPI